MCKLINICRQLLNSNRIILRITLVRVHNAVVQSFQKMLLLQQYLGVTISKACSNTFMPGRRAWPGGRIRSRWWQQDVQRHNYNCPAIQQWPAKSSSIGLTDAQLAQLPATMHIWEVASEKFDKLILHQSCNLCPTTQYNCTDMCFGNVHTTSAWQKASVLQWPIRHMHLDRPILH